MSSCEQMENLSVLEHGRSVAHYYIDIRNHVLYDEPLKYDWKLPDWIFDKSFWNTDLSQRDILTYQIYHDCGKPYCITYDEDGRKHFPNHSEVSYEISKEFFNDDISHLIKNDMQSHLTKPSNFKNFMMIKNYNILLITGLCEIHSNSKMFGGIESTSFKIKYKNLNKIGNNIIKQRMENNNE